MASAATDRKRVTPTRGGKDAAIVVPDDDGDGGGDGDAVARALFWNTMRNSGQMCIAAKRHDSMMR
jgi:acyl-CoA reductase-like NAD-dependent aldehyde dehydrogenase